MPLVALDMNNLGIVQPVAHLLGTAPALLVARFLYAGYTFVLQPARPCTNFAYSCMDTTFLMPTDDEASVISEGLRGHITVVTRTIEPLPLLLPMVPITFNEAIPSSAMMSVAEKIFKVTRALLVEHGYPRIRFFCRLPCADQVPAHYNDRGGPIVKITCTLYKEDLHTLVIEAGLTSAWYFDLPMFHANIDTTGNIISCSQESYATEHLLLPLVKVGYTLKGRGYMVNSETYQTAHYNVWLKLEECIISRRVDEVNIDE